MKRIVVLCSELPLPADQGSKIRNVLFLKSLSQFLKVHLVAVCSELPDPEQLAELHTFCSGISFFPTKRSFWQKSRDVWKSIWGPIPYQVLANTEPRARRKIEELLQKEQISGVHAAELCVCNNLPEEVGGSRPFIYDAHNVEAEVQAQFARLVKAPWAKLFYRFQSKWTRKFEQRISERANLLLSVSEADARSFKALSERVTVLPNGVELLPPSELAREPVILFVGTLQYKANADAVRWFLNNIWPEVSRGLPNYSFQIIGRHPPESLLRRASERVRFLTHVEDISPLMFQSALMVVPLRAGGGTRLKILDAFRHRLPVVSTKIGAAGLGVSHERELLLADDAKDFVSSVLRLGENKSVRDSLVENALQKVEREFSWENIFSGFRETYERALT